jgi:regulator of replication initiation timing
MIKPKKTVAAVMASFQKQIDQLAAIEEEQGKLLSTTEDQIEALEEVANEATAEMIKARKLRERISDFIDA